MSGLGVEYYSFQNNTIGFIVGFIILLVSYVWKVCNKTLLLMLLRWLHFFLCSLCTKHHNSQYLKIIVSIFFFSVFNLMNCCKFKKPRRNQYWKRAWLNKNYEIKCLNTRWCFTLTKIIYPKWCDLTYCWYWRHKSIQKIVLHYPLNYYLH